MVAQACRVLLGTLRTSISDSQAARWGSMKAETWLRFRSSWCWTTWMLQLGAGRALLPYLRSHVCARRPLFWIFGGIKFNRNKKAFPHHFGSRCVVLSVSCSCVNEYGRLWFPLQNCFNWQRWCGEDLLSPSLHSGKVGHLWDMGCRGEDSTGTGAWSCAPRAPLALQL